MAEMTVEQALKAIQTEVNYHAGSDTHYRAERLHQALATLRAEIDGLRAEVAWQKRVASAHAELHGEAEARAERLAGALEDIRSRSAMNSAMRPNPFALTAELGNIHQIADAAMRKEGRNG